MKGRIALLAGAAMLAGAVTLATQGAAQIAKGKSRPLLTKQLMSGLVGPATTQLGKDLQGAGPADEAGWQAAATRAALLNESGHMMMEDGRCPDAVWADACKQLREGSQGVLAKIEARDAAGARDMFTSVTASCKGCHTAHKPKKQ